MAKQIYKVKSGQQNWFALSMAIYGTEQYAQSLKAANKGKSPRTGMNIKAPPADRLKKGIGKAWFANQVGSRLNQINRGGTASEAERKGIADFINQNQQFFQFGEGFEPGAIGEAGTEGLADAIPPGGDFPTQIPIGGPQAERLAIGRRAGPLEPGLDVTGLPLGGGSEAFGRATQLAAADARTAETFGVRPPAEKTLDERQGGFGRFGQGGAGRGSATDTRRITTGGEFEPNLLGSALQGLGLGAIAESGASAFGTPLFGQTTQPGLAPVDDPFPLQRAGEAPPPVNETGQPIPKDSLIGMTGPAGERISYEQALTMPGTDAYTQDDIQSISDGTGAKTLGDLGSLGFFQTPDRRWIGPSKDQIQQSSYYSPSGSGMVESAQNTFGIEGVWYDPSIYTGGPFGGRFGKRRRRNNTNNRAGQGVYGQNTGNGFSINWRARGWG